MSKILRHDPTPLTMDSSGWINSIDLINHFNISMDDLIDIVKTNDKQRFRFNDDRSKICANQGHSKGVAEQKELSKMTSLSGEDIILYHGTDAIAAELIKNSYIKSGNRQHVHWTQNLELATKRAKNKAGWNKSKPVLITLEVKKYLNTHKGVLYLSDNNVYLTPEISGQLLNITYI